MFIFHEHALHHISVIQAEQELVRAVQLRDLPFFHDNRKYLILFLHPLPKFQRHICHLIETVRELDMEPLIYLLRPECFLAQVFHLFLQFCISIGTDIFFHSF